jgi:hypothetical protein
VFTDFITGLNLSQALEHSIDVAELDAPLVQQASVNAEAEAEAELQLQLQLPELPELEVLPDLVRETQTSETVVSFTSDGAEVKLTTVSSNQNNSSVTSGSGDDKGPSDVKGPSRANGTVPPVVTDLDAVIGGDSAAVRFSFRFGDSPIRAPQRIADFAFGKDLLTLLRLNGNPLPLPRFCSRAANNRTATTLRELADAVFADADGKRPGDQPLRRRSAALVRATNAEIRGTYLLVNNANPRLNPAGDLMIQLTGSSGRLPALGAIEPAALFG